MRRARLMAATRATTRSFAGMVPLVAGVLALASLVGAAVPPSELAEAVSALPVPDALVGAAVGSLSAGHPGVSYVLAGELRGAGVSLAGVTAFLVSWVTVGIIQLPFESTVLGLRFALWRNGVSFVLAVVIGHAVAAVPGIG